MNESQIDLFNWIVYPALTGNNTYYNWTCIDYVDKVVLRNDGPHCDQSGALKMIQLENNGLQGSLDDALGRFVELEELRLGANSLRSSLPSTLGQLTRLRILHLYHNRLSGTLPTELEAIGGTLEELYLHSNQLGGRLADFNWLKMSSLSWLYASSNQFEGPLPSTFTDSLRYLSLSRNQLTGTLLQHWPPRLAALHLYDNHLNDSNSFEHMQSLNELKELEYCQLVNVSNDNGNCLGPCSLAPLVCLEHPASNPCESRCMFDDVASVGGDQQHRVKSEAWWAALIIVLVIVALVVAIAAIEKRQRRKKVVADSQTNV